VSKNVEMGGGTLPAISAINPSEITPGPLGMFETKPRATAPQRIANSASARFDIQQILIRGCAAGCTSVNVSEGTK